MAIWSLWNQLSLRKVLRKTFVNVLIKIAENAQNRPGLFEFLFNVPIKLDDQPWKDYQHKLYAIIQGLLEDGVKQGEFPKVDPQLMFKALGAFHGLSFYGGQKRAGYR